MVVQWLLEIYPNMDEIISLFATNPIEISENYFPINMSMIELCMFQVSTYKHLPFILVEYMQQLVACDPMD